jgi:predicted ATPase
MSEAPFLKSLRYTPPNATPDDFPFSMPLFRRAWDLHFTSPLTILAGENGSGKSTLPEIIADNIGFSSNGGSQDHLTVETDVSLTALRAALRFGWLPKIKTGFFFRAESFATLATYLDTVANWPEPPGGAPRRLLGRSHGEGTLALMMQRLQRRGQAIYLFDEPEAALSPRSQILLRDLLRSVLATGTTQIVMATHLPLLMQISPGPLLYLDNEITYRDYRKTPHFEIYRDCIEGR